MESCTYGTRKLKLSVAVALTTTLIFSGIGCAKDENSPIIQQANMSESAIEGEDINFTVTTSDDRGTKEVYAEFDSGDKITLTKVDSQKDGEEISNWTASFKLSPGDHSYNVVADDKAGNKSDPREGKITVYSKDSLYGYTQGKGIDRYLSQLANLEKDGIVDANGKAFIDLIVKYQEADELVPGIYTELLKLPDLLTVDEKDIEACEDILILASNPEYRTAFESMLNEGVEDGRKYCTPLEGLLWIAYDREFDKDNPLDGYSLEKLINESWKRTKASNNYKSEKWDEFEEVIDRLNSPELVTKYCIDNIPYDFNKFAKFTGVQMPVQTAEETFIKKTGVCQDQASFVIYCLRENGYDYFNGDLNVYKNDAACRMSPGNPTMMGGHDACLYVKNGEIYVIDVGTGYAVRGIKGPVKTLEEAADIIYPGWDRFVMIDYGGSSTRMVVKKYFQKK